MSYYKSQMEEDLHHPCFSKMFPLSTLITRSFRMIKSSRFLWTWRTWIDLKLEVDWDERSLSWARWRGIFAPMDLQDTLEKLENLMLGMLPLAPGTDHALIRSFEQRGMGRRHADGRGTFLKQKPHGVSVERNGSVNSPLESKWLERLGQFGKWSFLLYRT